MSTYWLESEKKGAPYAGQYKHLSEIDKMASQNTSLTSNNPPDYLDYNFGGKGQQQQHQQLQQAQSQSLVNIDAS